MEQIKSSLKTIKTIKYINKLKAPDTTMRNNSEEKRFLEAKQIATTKREPINDLIMLFFALNK